MSMHGIDPHETADGLEAHAEWDAAALMRQMADRISELEAKLASPAESTPDQAEYGQLEAAHQTTADKADASGMTPAEYRDHCHNTAVAAIRAAAAGLYATVGIRVQDALTTEQPADATAPLTPCTCRQAIHALEHANRTVPGCTWCMPTPNIRPNRKPPRTTADVTLPDHTVDEEA